MYNNLKFLIDYLDYCGTANAASSSKFDANANVENKNIVTLVGEAAQTQFYTFESSYFE
ncbi:hypothetical protein [Candidatus Azobacteroides pseudotrichonymphae]|uniref:hypothetical protein n=1 Tax=Candidatus Azobacteroides pseudotrichonymphae TaxID=511435 RepID=UPI0002D47228|nr:hypothetical protein [Candidatus Azobacteroides pseudotrichonymphae]